MSYPRNAASPPRIAVGAVILVADGAVQTSGVSVVVRPEGGAESAGGGTIAYSAASGVIYYTPTQAETNYTAFCVIAYKAACIPAQVTVVPSASSTAGVAELDSSARVKLASDQPDYHPATTAELEARTIAAASYRQNISLRGSGMTEAKAFDLLLASLAGVTSQPSGTTEKFKFLDGNDAFTTTFDTNGNRTGVSLV